MAGRERDPTAAAGPPHKRRGRRSTIDDRRDDDGGHQPSVSLERESTPNSYTLDDEE